MDQSIVILVLGGWISVVVGLKFVLNHRARMKLGSPDNEKLDAILESLEDLRAEVAEIADNSHDLSQRVGEISGRVEFAERLLAQGEVKQDV